MMNRSYIQETDGYKFTVAGIYLGADVTKREDGLYSTQFALLPSQKHKKGGIITLNFSKELDLKADVVYKIEALSKSSAPKVDFGVTIYFLHTPSKLTPVAVFKEQVSSNG